MSADIGQKHPGNATGSAGRKIVDVAAAGRILMRTRVNPNIQTGPVKVFFHTLIASPDLQALHGLSHKSLGDGSVGAPMITKGMLTQGSRISQQLGHIADLVTHNLRIVVVPDESHH